MKNRRPWGYYLKILLAVVLHLAFALILLSGYFINRFTNSMLHPVRIPVSGDLLKSKNIPYETIKLTTRDGVQLSAWYTPPTNGAVILVAHGYNDNRLENLHAMFAQNGYGVLSWDFRAHGESEGDFSSLGYFEQLDVEAALDHALAQEGVEHIGAWGGSMGGAAVILTAARRKEIEAVVADSAFSSLEDVLRGSMHDLLFPLVAVFSEYYTGADIEAVSPVQQIGKIGPRAVLIIDGAEMNSPQLLYDGANEPREIWTEQGIPHLGMLGKYPKKYEKNVIDFFDQYLRER
jgi:uncharacterized protein